MSETNRQWLLRARPVGLVQESDFELREAAVPRPGEGQFLARNRWLAFENAPRTLLRLYTGANFGKQLLEL